MAMAARCIVAMIVQAPQAGAQATSLSVRNEVRTFG